MQNFKEHINKEIFKIISETGKEQGNEVYVIGGYVRDILLKRESHDIDVVTVGSGIQLAKAVSSKLPKTKVSIFKNFGTAMLNHRNDSVEFVGARKESYKRESRNPIVEDGTLEDDQNRRDFTINCLAISLNSDSYGKLIDPFDGIKDLENKILRTPLNPSITFSDDPLRMFRAIRFASQLGFTIEESALNAIKENRERIKILSIERISEELNKIILSPIPSIGFYLLDETGLLDLIFPEFVKLKGIEIKNGLSHKDNFIHTLQVLDNAAAKSDKLWLRWSAILHDIAKPATKRFNNKVGWTFHGHEDKGSMMVKGIFQRLRLPLDAPAQYVKKLVLLHLRPIALTNKTVSASAVRRLLFEAGEDIDDLMILVKADITSKNKNKVIRYTENLILVEEKMKEVQKEDNFRNWKSPVMGKDIMETFNIRPGKTIGIIKEKIKEAILDGKIANTKEDAITYMESLSSELGLEIQLEK
ncbi:MAG: HD domain-containing protein [Flavobacteriales bacterium]|nr:HD domain-containing protein [Flavobacteriales bacterium]